MARVDLDKLPPSDTRLEQLVLYTLLNDPFYFIYILQNGERAIHTFIQLKCIGCGYPIE